jgi:glycosyltransferase involved in cell wall biosynthesis
MRYEDVLLCVDTRMINKQGTGVSTYARGVAAAAKLIGRPTFFLNAEKETDGLVCKSVAAALPTASVRRIWDTGSAGSERCFSGRDIFRRAHVHFSLYRRFLRLNPPRPFGIMHWTYPVPLRIANWINVYTVHDAIPLCRPDLSPIGEGRHRAVMAALRMHADRIVTVSDAARRDIVSLGFDGTQVVDCGQAVLECSQHPSDELPPGLAVGGYFLFCGVLEPRKNLIRLILAHGRSGTRYPLVIAGPDGWRGAAIVEAIRQAPNVLRIGYVSRPTLLALIRGARALLFPSLAEGFGLPVIEAMRLGTPVLTSADGALAEVAGQAALLIDPTDVDALARGICALSENEALAADLARRGRTRAGCFTIERFASRLAVVYDEVIRAYSVVGGGSVFPRLGR